MARIFCGFPWNCLEFRIMLPTRFVAGEDTVRGWERYFIARQYCRTVAGVTVLIMINSKVLTLKTQYARIVTGVKVIMSEKIIFEVSFQ
jgi:hypothetical protein